jgi:hypothetical protein
MLDSAKLSTAELLLRNFSDDKGKFKQTSKFPGPHRKIMQNYFAYEKYAK